MRFRVAQVRESTADSRQWWVCADYADGEGTKYAFVSRLENPDKKALIGRTVQITSGRNAEVVEEIAASIDAVHSFAASHNKRTVAREIIASVRQSLKELEDLI